MLALAAATAESLGAGYVYYGAHKGDRVIYPDCRPAFVVALAETWKEMGSPVGLVAPLLNHTKARIVKLGAGLGFPFDRAWTCYRGGSAACGACGSCQERLAAFAANELDDPADYESRVIFPAPGETP
jgi:7-cyano-7-deazaguanine synthase